MLAHLKQQLHPGCCVLLGGEAACANLSALISSKDRGEEKGQK